MTLKKLAFKFGLKVNIKPKENEKNLIKTENISQEKKIKKENIKKIFNPKNRTQS